MFSRRNSDHNSSINNHLNFRRQSMPKTLSNPKGGSPVKGYNSSQLKNTTMNQDNNENTSKIEYYPPPPATNTDPKKALATRPLNKYSFEIAIENALKDNKEEESLVNEIAIADKILGDFNIPNSLLADLEEATFKEEQQQNYITPVKNKNPVNIIKAIHYDAQPSQPIELLSSSAKKNTPNLKLSEKIHQSGAKSREGSARRRSISDVILSPTYKDDLSKRISARKTEEQTNETSVTLITESSTKPKPSTKQQQPKPQILDCFSGKSSTNKAKTRFNNQTEGRVGLDKLKSMYSDIFESKKPPKKSQHTKKPSQIPSFIAENKPVPAPKPVMNVNSSHVKAQPAKSHSHMSSKSFSIAVTSNHESHAGVAQSSLLDTSLELQLKNDEANSKKPQAKKNTITQSKTKLDNNSISKTNSNLVSAAHSRSSSIGFRSTYQTLSVLNEQPTPAPVNIQENAAPKRLSKRSKSNVSFNSLLNRRRSSENTSFCVNSLIKQDKPKVEFEPIMEVDDEKTHKYDEAASKISENTFVVLQSVLKRDGVVYLCCQAFFNLFSGLKGFPSFQDSNFEEIQAMMNSPFDLFSLTTSYKSMVKNGQVPKDNVHKALFTLAKIPFCDDDLQGKEYYDLLKFLTIAVEFYKSHKEVTKPIEQTPLDMSRFSQKTAVKRPSKNQEKGWEDGNISSVMKYVQEDLYQGDDHKKTEIIEKLKALQHRRSKSIGNASNLLPVPVSMERFKQRASIHNIVNNVKERIKNHERRKSEHNLKSHTLMFPEDTEVESLQNQIYRDKVTARDFRGKTKRLLVDHDRFVKKQIKQEIEEYANFNREDALEERARLLDYLLHRDEDEKEFVTDMNHEDIEHRRELKAHEKIQRTYEIEENIQETYKESILNSMIQDHARKENKMELYEKFQDALLARSVKIAKAQSESQSLMDEIAERRLDSFHMKHLSVLQEREKWQSEYSTLSDLIGDAQ